jgi:hypothetical protein
MGGKRRQRSKPRAKRGRPQTTLAERRAYVVRSYASGNGLIYCTKYKTKVVYQDKQSAEKAAGKLRELGGSDQKAYKCHETDHWHLTTIKMDPRNDHLY